MRQVNVIPLDSSQSKLAASILAAAFHHDPMYLGVFPDEARRARALSWLFERVVRYSVMYGETFTTPDLAGIACWLPPGLTDLTLGRMLRSGLAATPFRLGVSTSLRFFDFLRSAPPGHWYLWALAVDPSCQGQGIGGRLIAPVLARASRDGAACYLETEVERNLVFYGKHGFKVVAEWDIPGQGVTMWAMLREPQGDIFENP